MCKELKERQCKKCDKWFVCTHKRKLCHNPCGKTTNYTGTCKVCGEDFSSRGYGKGGYLFCSEDCRIVHKANMAIRVLNAKLIKLAKKTASCRICNKDFIQRRAGRITCGAECGRK